MLQRTEYEEIRKRPHLSASQVTAYMDCGLHYRFAKIDRIKPKSTSAEMLLGSAIHLVLADYYAAIREGMSFSITEMKESFTGHWQRLCREAINLHYQTGKDDQVLLRGGLMLLEAFHRDHPGEDGMVMGIEEPFVLTIPGIPIPVIGVYDLVLEDDHGVVIIVDHKTTAKSYSNAEIDKNFQMTLYHMAARANGFANREILLRLDTLVKTKEPKFIQCYTTRSEMDELRAIQKIKAVWHGIQQGVFIPNDNSWKCSGCSYRSHCDQWFMDKTHQGETPTRTHH